MQSPWSVGALYCFFPEIREKMLLSSRSASSCRCLGSCENRGHVSSTAKNNRSHIFISRRQPVHAHTHSPSQHLKRLWPWGEISAKWEPNLPGPHSKPHLSNTQTQDYWNVLILLPNHSLMIQVKPRRKPAAPRSKLRVHSIYVHGHTTDDMLCTWVPTVPSVFTLTAWPALLNLPAKSYFLLYATNCSWLQHVRGWWVSHKSELGRQGVALPCPAGDQSHSMKIPLSPQIGHHLAAIDFPEP